MMTETQSTHKKSLTGTVVNVVGESTASVKIVRKVKHPVYGKIVSRFKNYAVHMADTKAKVGDKVLIVQSRPISKTKTWLLADIIN